MTPPLPSPCQGEGTQICLIITLSILWHLAKFSQRFHRSRRIIATEANAYLLERARTGCYQWGSLKDIPSDWLAKD